MDHDIHNYERQLSYELKIIEKSQIPERNKKLLEQFKRDLTVEGIKLPRIIRYLQTLRIVTERWKQKPFDEWDEDDLKDVLYAIQTNGYSANTVYEYRKGLKKFFKWLNGEEWKGLKLLRGKIEPRDEKKPNILTEDEIKQMIAAALNERDKALIAVGYDAGLRIGELAGLRWGDIVWTDFGARIKVKGKKGERYVPVVMAAPYLKSWLPKHPKVRVENGRLEVDPSEYVFVNIGHPSYGEPMEYRMLAKIIKQAAIRAGIKKRIYTHILRHSRATVLASWMKEAQLCNFFGWIQGSKMAKIYVHMSGRDVEAALLRYYGIETDEEKKLESKLKPIECPRCAETNEPTNRFCGRCGLLLDEKERLQVQMEEPEVVSDLMETVLKNPSLLEKFKEMLKVVETLEKNPKLLQAVLELKVRA
jgi:integrase